MKGKVFYSDHRPYTTCGEKRNYSLLWVNKNFRTMFTNLITFKNRYGWMIKDGYLYDLKDKYEDHTPFGKYEYKQITEAAHDLFQGVNDVEASEKIMIVDSKEVPRLMSMTGVHHYIPMFDGHAYSFDANGNLECWRIVNEVEVKENEEALASVLQEIERTVVFGEIQNVTKKISLKHEQRKVLESMLQELERKHEIYGNGPMLITYTAAEADTLTQTLKVILENS